MPRIYASNSDPFDFCIECMPDEDEARQRFGNFGDGPDGRGDCFGYAAEHPDYEDSGYTCLDCDGELNEEDD